MTAALLAAAAAALAAAPVVRRWPRFAVVAAPAVPAALFAYFAVRAGSVAGGEVETAGLAWMDSLGVRLSFRLDGLSLLFALLVTGIGTVVVAYSGAYFQAPAERGRFLALLFGFMAAMLGVVLADDMIALFCFWELTSVTSALLVGFHHEKEKARKAAVQALLVTGLGGLALLAGLILLTHAAGTTSLAAVTAGGLLRHDMAGVAAVLVLVGAFAKSAQFPFHFWLPNAMEAPTPASAYLHSATMVKAGIYLMARLHPALAGTLSWTVLVPSVGAISMVVGGVLALRETYAKRVLAYTTISALGTMCLLLGLERPAAVAAATVFLVAHALYKAALFLVAGSLAHSAGTGDLAGLRGLRRGMPWTAVAAALAGLSMAGAPPALGFIAKETLFEVALPLAAVAGAAFVAQACVAAAAGLTAFGPFVGSPPEKAPHEAPAPMVAGPLLLAALGILFGLFPGLLQPLLDAVQRTGWPASEPARLALWHGLTPALALSAGVLALGFLGWRAAPRVRATLGRCDGALRMGPAAAYDAVLAATMRLAAAVARVFQHGYLRLYVLVVIGVVAVLVAVGLLRDGAWRTTLEPGPAPRPFEVALGALAIAGAWAAVRARSRLAAAASLGVVGYAVALLFLVLGAPDLALTQLVVETLTVILFVLVFSRLPPFPTRTGTPTRTRDVAVAASLGLVVFVLVAAAGAAGGDGAHSDWYERHSLDEGHGRNVVNVILVDFRAFDTLGEITVLAVAAFGIHALLRWPKARER